MTIQKLKELGYKVHVYHGRTKDIETKRVFYQDLEEGLWLNYRNNEFPININSPYLSRGEFHRVSDAVLSPTTKFGDVILNYGGVTRVNLINKDGVSFTGEAVCSKKDNFSKKTGLKIAIGRALKAEKEFYTLDDYSNTLISPPTGTAIAAALAIDMLKSNETQIQ